MVIYSTIFDLLEEKNLYDLIIEDPYSEEIKDEALSFLSLKDISSKFCKYRRDYLSGTNLGFITLFTSALSKTPSTLSKRYI